MGNEKNANPPARTLYPHEYSTLFWLRVKLPLVIGPWGLRRRHGEKIIGTCTILHGGSRKDGRPDEKKAEGEGAREGE